MTYRHLKTGSSVTHLLAGTIPMPMRVLRVDASLIYCTPREMTLNAAVRRELIWTFDRATSAEVDEDLRWGPAYGSLAASSSPTKTTGSVMFDGEGDVPL